MAPPSCRAHQQQSATALNSLIRTFVALLRVDWRHLPIGFGVACCGDTIASGASGGRGKRKAVDCLVNVDLLLCDRSHEDLKVGALEAFLQPHPRG